LTSFVAVTEQRDADGTAWMDCCCFTVHAVLAERCMETAGISHDDGAAAQQGGEKDRGPGHSSGGGGETPRVEQGVTARHGSRVPRRGRA